MKIGMRTYCLLITTIIVTCFILPSKGQQSNEGFIYGKVTTRSGHTYTGHIRWGKEEIFWNDFFNSIKTSTNFIGNSKKSIKNDNEDGDDSRWPQLDWEILSIWEDKHHSSYHKFDIRFGDIKSLQMNGSNVVIVLLKNGVKIKVNGGSNDIGTSVKVYDNELGLIAIHWENIKQVEFMASPPKTVHIFGTALHGKVETFRKGNYEGYIQWDHDERVSTDVLNGTHDRNKLDIEFGNIKELESKNNGTITVTKSGRRFFLTGSNDVNRENRGIIVTNEQVGKINIPWKEFKKVTFNNHTRSGAGYDQYTSSKALRGSVKDIQGNEIQGSIIFDLDENWDFEFLDGKDDDISYFIPFRNIKQITPKNYNYSIVKLKNGNELLLGDTRDVNEENDGLLVFKRGEVEPVYIKWNAVDQIIFE